MQDSLSSGEGQAVVANMQNFATGGVTMRISDLDA